MSTTYHTLLRAVAHQVGALRGDSPQGIETSYTTVLTAAQLGLTGKVSLTVLKDAVLAAEESIALAIATTGNHPWRAVLRAFTANLADKAVVPAVDSASKQIIGSYGAVRDSSDNTPLVERPLSVIDRRVRNSSTHYVIPAYWYKFDGAIIRHTRTNVVIEVCSYDRSTQATALTANSAMLLPDPTGPAIVNLAASLLDHRLAADLATALIQGIKAGNTSTIPRSIPRPVTLEKAG